MSTVKATNFQHPSSAAANITLGSDGSVVLPAGFSGGLGTNVVQTVKTDTFTTASTSYTDITGLTATITPSSATAKVLIVVQLNVSTTATDGHITAVAIGGGNAAGYVGDTASNRTTMASGVRLGTPYDYSRSVVTLSVVYLDSPATTSPTTYSAQVKAVGGTAYVNRSYFDTDNNTHPRAASSITVIEVAA